MKDLIEALTIFLKYADKRNPTHCEHDTLYVVGISPKDVAREDRKRLRELGFIPNDENDGWQSFRFGSA